MKIKINLAETYFLKWVMQTFIDAENESQENRLIAKDIINKLNK